MGGSAADGELREFVGIHRMESVEFLMTRGRNEVNSLTKDARFLVFPSEWYECFP